MNCSWYPFLLVVFMLLQCGEKKEEGAALASMEKASNDRATSAGPGNPHYRNNISIQPGGLVISQGFLTHENGMLLNRENVAQQGQPVYLNLLIEKGWKVINGKISAGAEQSIATDKGEEVLRSGDLFANAQSISRDEASRIRIKAVITRTRSDIRFFVVRFRLWDKNSKAEARGSYQLFVNKR